MDAEHIYYMTLQRTDETEQEIRIGDKIVTRLPLAVSRGWERQLKSGSRWRGRLFRFFCLRRLVRGKETVVMSDGVRALLPENLRYENMTADLPEAFCSAYALMELEKITQPRGETAADRGLLAVLPKGGTEPEVLAQILTAAQEMDGVYLWTFDDEEKDWIEDRLEALMEESGVAGMCYPAAEADFENPYYIAGKPKKEQSSVILLDFSDQPLAKLWGLDYYIDGSGKKSRKEIKILTGRHTRVKALRNYLDRAF